MSTPDALGVAVRVYSGYAATMLPPGQQRMLDAITAHWRARGYGPTYAELAETLGLRSKTAVTGSIDALVRKGYLLRDVGVPRSVRLVGGARDV